MFLAVPCPHSKAMWAMRTGGVPPRETFSFEATWKFLPIRKHGDVVLNRGFQYSGVKIHVPRLMGHLIASQCWGRNTEEHAALKAPWPPLGIPMRILMGIPKGAREP